MKKNKLKGFSLIEAMVLFIALSLILLAFVPVMIKRAQRVHEADCENGVRNVVKEYTQDDTFTVPREIASDLTVTLIGAGGGGARGEVEPLEYVNNSHCSIKVTGNPFYTNVNFRGVTAGGDTDCSGNKAGGSGISYYLDNIEYETKLDAYNNTQKYISLVYETGMKKWTLNRSDIDNNASSSSGQDGKCSGTPSTCTPSFLQGGVPTIRMGGNYGVGQSCKANAGNTAYEPSGNIGDEHCRITYNLATRGYGGGAGAYAKFTLSNIAANTNIAIRVGRGGASEAAGEESGINVGSNNYTATGVGITKYTAGGGQAATPWTYNNGANTYEKGEVGKGGSLNINIRPEMILEYQFYTYGTATEANKANPNLPYNNIQGGEGGNMCKNAGCMDFIPGSRGGCFGAEAPAQCIDPDGKDGFMGSGGGGGSCNENGCGVGGRGGDGLVRIEYKEFCR